MKSAKMLGLGVLVTALAAAGCGQKSAAPAANTADNVKKDGDHAHGAGPNGGVVFDLGKYHAEFTVDHDKNECVVLVLGGDHKDAKPLAVDAKEFTLTTKATKTKKGTAVAPMTIKLLPADAKGGKASRYVGTDPGLGNVAGFAGTVVGLIDGKPSQGEFKEDEEHDDHKKAIGPADDHGRAVAQNDPKEADVFLKPGGLYTEADIEANGGTTASAKYKGLKASHDTSPKVGDRICPVTLTKSNPELTWVVGGKTYQFCCQPCVEEFVLLAKTKPEEVKAPEAYVKK